MSIVINGTTVAIAPPKGYIVDFDNPRRRLERTNYIVAGSGMGMALLFLLQRVYVKLRIQRSFGADDYCVVIAWAFTIAIQGLIINSFATQLYGIHTWEIPLERFGRYLLIANYVQSILYVFPTVLSKLTLLIFYIKLQNRHLWYQVAVWFTIFIDVGSGLGIIFSIAFSCNPPARAFDITITTGSCIDLGMVFQASAVFGIVTDMLIFAIPIPMVLGLQLSRRKKAGLFLLFTFGSVTVITSIVRLYLLIRHLDRSDITWSAGPIMLWITIEANLLIICACLPTLKAFIQALSPRSLGSSGRTGWRSKTTPGVSTVGSTRPKPRRDQYHEFDDVDVEENRVATVVEGGKDVEIEMEALGHRRAGSDGSVGSSGGGKGGSFGDAAKEIVQNTTMEIRYEERRPS